MNGYRVGMGVYNWRFFLLIYFCFCLVLKKGVHILGGWFCVCAFVFVTAVNDVMSVMFYALCLAGRIG